MADMMDLPEYLSVDFEPNSVTVPRLRSILLENGVDSASGLQKKSQLVDLFNSAVAPKVGRLRAARLRATRSSFGIVNADEPDRAGRSRSRKRTPALTPEQVATDRVEEPRSTARRRSRSVVAPPVPLDETSENTPVEPKARSVKRTSRSKSRRQTEAQQAETPPTAKHNEWEPGEWKKTGENSPFRLDNPFQSGTPAPRRQSPSRPKSRVSTVSGRRGQSYATPARRRPKTRADDMSDSDVETAIASQLSVSDLDSESTSSPSGESRPSAASVWAVVLAVAAILFTVWRQEKISVGYCGLGHDEGFINLGGWIDWARPECEPCPINAICSENLVAECYPGFVLVNHPLSLGGLIPIAPECKTDGVQAMRVRAIGKKIVDLLRGRRADYECGVPDDAGIVPESAEISVDALKEKIVSLGRSDSISDDAFNEMWDMALPATKQYPEVVRRADSGSIFLSSTSTAAVPFSCSVRRWVRYQVERFFERALLVFTIVLGLVGLRYWYTERREMKVLAEALAREVIEMLEEQALNHSIDPARYPEPFIGIPLLRDDLLRDIFPFQKREKLWSLVRLRVEVNANIRITQRELSNGDVTRVYEWTGAVRPSNDVRAGGWPNPYESARRRSSGNRSSSRLTSAKLEPEMDGSTPPVSARPSNYFASAEPSPLTSRWQRGEGAYRRSNTGFDDPSLMSVPPMSGRSGFTPQVERTPEMAESSAQAAKRPIVRDTASFLSNMFSRSTPNS